MENTKRVYKVIAEVRNGEVSVSIYRISQTDTVNALVEFDVVNALSGDVIRESTDRIGRAIYHDLCIQVDL